MILPSGATVAVLDGRTLRLFRNKGHEPAIDLVALPDADLETHHAGSGARHRSSPANPDAGRLTEDDFIAAVGAFLNRASLEGDLQSIVIIADARSLGELRRHLHPTLLAKIVGEIHKELHGHPLADIKAEILDA
jgi:protein required for attachment to host cells